MLEQVQEPIEKFSGDGAYDKSTCWDILEQYGIEGIILPRKDAVYWVNEADELLDHDRNRILERIDKIGPKLYSRKFDIQEAKNSINVRALNIIIAQGMPISIKVA